MISLIIADIQGKTLFIDTWIMSCRVLKRGVETYVLNQIVEKAKALGISEIVGEYIPTPKNDLVREHYKNLGFSQMGDTHNWKLEIEKFEMRPHFIKTKQQQ